MRHTGGRSADHEARSFIFYAEHLRVGLKYLRFTSIRLRGTFDTSSIISSVTQINEQRRKVTNMVGTNGSNGNNGSTELNGDHAARVGTIRVKQGLAQMLKGGVIVS